MKEDICVLGDFCQAWNNVWFHQAEVIWELGIEEWGEKARALAAAKEEDRGRHNEICQNGLFGSDGYGGQRKRKRAMKTGRLRNSYSGSH